MARHEWRLTAGQDICAVADYLGLLEYDGAAGTIAITERHSTVAQRAHTGHGRVEQRCLHALHPSPDAVVFAMEMGGAVLLPREQVSALEATLLAAHATVMLRGSPDAQAAASGWVAPGE